MDSYHVVTLLVDGDKLGKLHKQDFEEVRNVVVIINEIPLNKQQKKAIKAAIPHITYWDRQLQPASSKPLTPIWPYTENCKSLWVTMHAYPSKHPLQMRAATTGCGTTITREIKRYDSGKLAQAVMKELNTECLPRVVPKIEPIKEPRKELISNPTTWIDRGINYIYSIDKNEATHAWQAVLMDNPKKLHELFEKYNVVENVLDEHPPEMDVDFDAKLPEDDEPTEDKIAKTNRCIRAMFPRWNVHVTKEAFE